MATQPSRTFMTYQEFEELDRFGKITELLDGEFFVVSPIFRHQEIVGSLYLAFRSYLAEHPLGKVLVAPFDIVLSKEQRRGRVIQPDIM
ncbi:MAG: Uma2 family endonuclease, partial [Candidatus Sericytochromatia bacterium]|nr:Uma2 family endonuclease [Candidatus Tanganyikabacteria bacterium]